MGAVPEDSGMQLKETTETNEDVGSQSAVPVERTITVTFAEEETKTADCI